MQTDVIGRDPSLADSRGVEPEPIVAGQMPDRISGQPDDNAAEITRYELQYNWLHNSEDKGKESAENNE